MKIDREVGPEAQIKAIEKACDDAHAKQNGASVPNATLAVLEEIAARLARIEIALIHHR